jgi:plasmid stability protein
MQAVATLTLRNVPDDLYEDLKQRAAKHRRSLNQEVISILETRADHDVDLAAMRADAFRARMAARGVRVTADEVEGWIKEGRR